MSVQPDRKIKWMIKLCIPWKRTNPKTNSTFAAQDRFDLLYASACFPPPPFPPLLFTFFAAMLWTENNVGLYLSLNSCAIRAGGLGLLVLGQASDTALFNTTRAIVLCRVWLHWRYLVSASGSQTISFIIWQFLSQRQSFPVDNTNSTADLVVITTCDVIFITWLKWPCHKGLLVR